MAKAMKVELVNYGNGLNEIYQDVNMKFAFLTAPKDGSKQCCDWVKCRDFLHDAVRTQVTGNKSSIYGFHFDTKTNAPIDLKKMRMLVTLKSLTAKQVTGFEKKLKAGLKLLNHYEKMAGISLSKLHRCAHSKDTPYVWAFIGPRMWMTYPQLVSMHTLLIRLGDKEKDIKFTSNKSLIECLKNLSTKYSDNDARYLRDCWDKLHLVIKNRKKIFLKNMFMEAKGTSIHSFHDYCGIQTLCANQSTTINGFKPSNALMEVVNGKKANKG